MDSTRDEYGRARRQLERLRRCFASCNAIASTLTLESVLDELMTNVMDNLGAENCSVYLVDEARDELFLTLSKGPLGSAIPVNQRLARGEKVPGRAWAQRRTLRLGPDELEHGRDFVSPLAVPGRAVSTMCIPLEAAGEVQGVAKITNKRGGGPFDEDDQEVFELACRQAAISIRNAWYHHGELERQELESELERASEVQRMLVPEVDPLFPACQVAAVSERRGAVGGDYLGWLTQRGREEDLLGLMVADAVGHDLPAGLLMVTLRAYIRAQAHLLAAPGRFVSSVNRLFAADTAGQGLFCTFFLLLLDLRAETLAWVGAGNHPALLYDPATDELTRLPSSGPALGCMGDGCYRESTMPLPEPGCVCLLATDGIYETAGHGGELFGMERAGEVLRENAGRGAREVRRALFAALEAFREAQAPEDDITAAVVAFR
ncbi:MAG: PP2C family protein-serine/threonine phosphatase [Desulfovibrionaceae bacterium]